MTFTNGQKTSKPRLVRDTASPCCFVLSAKLGSSPDLVVRTQGGLSDVYFAFESFQPRLPKENKLASSFVFA